MERVLITGGRAPVALELARQLSQSGKKVFVADSAPCFLASSSRNVEKSFRIPRPRQSPQAFADAIEEIIVRERIEQIVPTCEEVFYLSRFGPQLRRHAELFCMEFELLRQLHDKWSFTKLARGHGVEVPDTWLVADKSSLSQLPLPAGDLVFKPVFSRFAVHTLVKPTDAEVRQIDAHYRNWVAQRFVLGKELCSYAVARDGKLLAHALYEPVWRLGRSSSYYFAAVQRPAVEEFTRSFVASLNYTGQIAFDFIEAADGKIFVLECNPRGTSGLHLFSSEDKLHRAFDGTACDSLIKPSSAQPRMLATIMAVLGPLQALRGAKPRRLIADFARAKDTVWNAQDPLPSFYSFMGLAAFLCIALRERMNPLAASTHDIEWDGQEIPARI